MYKDALTAVEQSSGNDSRLVWCEATEENLYWLRKWSNQSVLWGFEWCGETHHHDRWEFRGWDYDHDGSQIDWCVAVEPPEEV